MSHKSLPDINRGGRYMAEAQKNTPTESSATRFSDLELVELRKKIDDHVDEFKQYRENDAARWDQVLAVQEENGRQLKCLTDSTRDLINAWEAIGGSIRVMSAVGRFAKWLGSIAILGAALTWVVNFISNNGG